MPRWLFLFFVLALTGCAAPAFPTAQPGQANYPDLGAAPELSGDTWLNTPAPLQLAALRGKVVLVDMWTFDCINCQHVIPSLRVWYNQYAAQGFVVIGNHYPEFSYESKLDNLKQAIKDLNVPYPVVQDNDGANWNAYKNRYWPTMYLVDKKGRIRYIQIGEGNYTETEQAIVALLAEPAN